MKNEIKNNHSESITLFVKRSGVEQQVYIPAGHSIVVDAYETKTMRVFAKRGFISIIPAQLFTADSFALLEDEPANEISVSKTIDETISSNNDEIMDHFHTTETQEVLLMGEDIEHLQKNPLTSLEIPFEVKSREGEPTVLEIIEGEVDKYVEGGFIKGEWAEEDLAFLKKNYPTKGRKYCSTHLNRNESSVQKKINTLGLKKKKKK